METKNLLENEEKITSSGDNVLLTNMRLRYQAGGKHFISMMLEKISAIEIHYRSHLWALIIGVVLIAAGCIFVFQNSQSEYGDPVPGFLGVFCGGIFVVYFIITRKHVIKISASCGTKIEFITKGMKSEAIIDFIDKVEAAKNKRFLGNK